MWRWGAVVLALFISGNCEIAQAAVKQSGGALENASEELQGERRMRRLSVKRSATPFGCRHNSIPWGPFSQDRVQGADLASPGNVTLIVCKSICDEHPECNAFR